MKKSQVDKAIDRLEAEKRAIDQAIAALRSTQTSTLKRKPRPAVVERVGAH